MEEKNKEGKKKIKTELVKENKRGIVILVSSPLVFAGIQHTDREREEGESEIKGNNCKLEKTDAIKTKKCVAGVCAGLSSSGEREIVDFS